MKIQVAITRIILFYYCDFRLVDNKSDDFNVIFTSELSVINDYISELGRLTYDNRSQFFTLECNGVGGFKENHQKINSEFPELLLFPLHSTEKGVHILESLEQIKDGLGDDKFKFYQEVLRSCLMTSINDQKDCLDQINFLAEFDVWSYNLIASLLVTFRGNKDLKLSIKFISKAIEMKENVASLYLFRLRNTFLYIYGEIGVSKFHSIISQEPQKIIDSTPVKCIFSDIFCVQKYNSKHPTFPVFVGNIYVHLYMEEGVKKLEECLERVNYPTQQQCLEWIGNYYLFTGNYNEAIFRYKKIQHITHKYYKKLFPALLLSGRHQEFTNEVERLIKDEKYEVIFYERQNHSYTRVSGNPVQGRHIEDYRDINFPLDVNILQYRKLCKLYMKENNFSIFFPYIRKNFHKYFLGQTQLGIILKSTQNAK